MADTNTFEFEGKTYDTGSISDQTRLILSRMRANDQLAEFHHSSLHSLSDARNFLISLLRESLAEEKES